MLQTRQHTQQIFVDDVLTRPRSADTATITAIFVVLQFALPAKLVMNGLPLSLSAASIVALGMGALWMCTQFTTTLGAAKGRNPVRTMLFVYACAVLASYGSSSFGYLPPDERAIGDHAMVTLFAMVFLALAVCDGVRSRDRIYFLLRAMVVCATIVAVVGIVQFLFSYDLTPHLRPPGMHFTTDDSAVLARDGLRRVAGTTAHPIEFGVFSAMMLPLAIHVAYQTGLQGRRASLWWTCVGLIAAGLMFSVSRSAMLAVTVSFLVLFLGWSARRRVWMLITAIAFLVLIKLAAPGLLGAIFKLFAGARNDDSIKWRTHDYATAKTLISQHLLLGRGVGTWYAPKHEVFDNQYLLTLVDSGLIGLLAFLGLLLAGIYAALRVEFLCYTFPSRVTRAASDRDLALSLAASLVVIIPTYATFDFAAFATVTSLSYLLLGIAAALLRTVSAEVAGTPPDPYAVV